MSGGTISEPSKRHYDLGRFFVGLTVVALGIVILLGKFGVIESDNYLQYWPAILVAFGLAKVLEPRGGGRMFGFVLATIGVVMLLERFGMIGWDVWDLWPLLIVLFGLSLIWGAFGQRQRRRRCRTTVSMTRNDDAPPPRDADGDPEQTFNVSSVFGGNERVITSRDFRGGSISTMMGGCNLDLRPASIATGEATIDVSVVLGGVEIRVPDDWRVVIRINPLLGGVDDKTRKPTGAGAKTLMLTGSVFMGGLEVRN